jgi:MscS family membrane protein
MFENPIIYNTVMAILIIIGSGVLGQILKYLMSTIFKRLFAYTDTTLDDRLLTVVRSRVTKITIIIGFYIAVGIARDGVPVEFGTYHHVLDFISVALYIILVLVLTRLVSRLIEAMFEWYMDEVSAKTHNNVTSTVAPLMTKIVNIILFLIAGMIVLDHFGVNIGSLLVSLGVGSLAVALAAQETVANVIAGFVILIDQPFRVGDRLKLPSGEEGDVYQIGLRSTRILNFDNNLVVIPNSELVKNRLINFSFPDQQTRVLVEVKVAFGTDLGAAKSILLNLASECPGILKDPPPRVFCMEFEDTGLLLRLTGRTNHFDKKFEIETDLRENIYKRFGESGIEIPLPKRIVYTVNPNEAKTPQTK